MFDVKAARSLAHDDRFKFGTLFRNQYLVSACDEVEKLRAENAELKENIDIADRTRIQIIRKLNITMQENAELKAELSRITDVQNLTREHWRTEAIRTKKENAELKALVEAASAMFDETEKLTDEYVEENFDNDELYEPERKAREGFSRLYRDWKAK